MWFHLTSNNIPNIFWLNILITDLGNGYHIVIDYIFAFLKKIRKSKILFKKEKERIPFIVISYHNFIDLIQDYIISIPVRNTGKPLFFFSFKAIIIVIQVISVYIFIKSMFTKYINFHYLGVINWSLILLNYLP